MTKLAIEKLIAAFKELTPVELDGFVKVFEEELDVTAVAPVAAVAAAPVADGEATAVEEEKNSFDVALEAAGGKKVAVTKEVYVLASLGLEKAKGLADSAPKAVLESVDKEAANKAKEQPEGADASVTVK